MKANLRILKLYERSLEQKGQSNAEFELSKELYNREQKRLNLQICKRADGSLFFRKLKLKIDTICICPLCESTFKLSDGKQYFHNYGGIPQKKYVCSSNCLEIVKSLIGERMSNKLARLY